VRRLWTVAADPDAAKACEDVTFEDKPKTPADNMMDNIMSQRSADKPLDKFAAGGDATDYAMSLIIYSAPWAVLAILSILGW